MRSTLLIAFTCILVSFSTLKAQELYSTVTVISPTIQQTPTMKSTFKTLESSIREFLNTKSWTGDVYQPTERIECQFLITVNSYDVTTGTFSGTMQISSNRPVYGSNYNLSLLNILDRDINFKYVEFQPIDYVEGTYINDLSSILAYYAYLIIGMDFDSYVEYGGTPAYTKAVSIVNSAQSSTITGWKSGEKNDKNRYFIITELMDEQRGKIYRKVVYNYHRQGFDLMYDDVDKGREGVARSLEALDELYKANPFSPMLQTFFLCKKEEIMTTFSQAQTSVKTKVSSLCQEMDPGNSSKYAERLRP